MSDYLTGAGHFGVGFVIGFAIFLLLLIAFRKALWARLYGPFIPFMLGGLAALPYFFTHQLMCDYSSWVQVFFFYPFFHCQPLLVKFFSNLYIVVLVCGLLYVLIVWHYIRLVKYVRRYGWQPGIKAKKKRRRHA